MTEQMRRERGLIMDCLLGPLANEMKCEDSKDCKKCGWNPEENERRQKECKLHIHRSGLRGF